MDKKMSEAEVKDNHLHITYEVYDYGLKTRRKIIPLEDIECINANIGKRGGMHTWSIRGYHPEYSESKYNKDRKRDIEIYSGDRKDAYLIEHIQKLLPNIKSYFYTEDGGSPW